MAVKGAKVLAYHGTDAKGAKSILRSGFRANTYFALHLEDAIGFGGLHVFAVPFLQSKILSRSGDPEDAWQFTIKKSIPPSRVQFYRVYKVKEVKSNLLLGEEVYLSNVPIDERPIIKKLMRLDKSGPSSKETPEYRGLLEKLEEVRAREDGPFVRVRV